MTETPFGSTLSTAGYLAVRKAGFRPLRQVQGTSVISLGRQPLPSRKVRGSLTPQRLAGVYGATAQVYVPRGGLAVQQFLNEGGWMELEQRTAAYNDARRQALSHLRDEAREAGAMAVVDVRIRRGRFPHASGAIQFTALGTAIGSDRYELEEQETLSLVSLSGADFWKLFAAGHWPVGLVGGTSVVYVMSGFRTKYARFKFSRRSWQNQEFEDYTHGVYQARIRAMGRLHEEARQVRATGVIAIDVGREQHEAKDENMMLMVDVLGNAISPIEQGAPHDITYALGLGRT
jgi:uncharacterized protein YbjQ (UPF0145 family)